MLVRRNSATRTSPCLLSSTPDFSMSILSEFGRRPVATSNFSARSSPVLSAPRTLATIPLASCRTEVTEALVITLIPSSSKISPIVLLENRDLDPKSAKHLSQLERDVTAADDDEGSRQLAHLHQFVVS